MEVNSTCVIVATTVRRMVTLKPESMYSFSNTTLYASRLKSEGHQAEAPLFATSGAANEFTPIYHIGYMQAKQTASSMTMMI